MTDFSDAQLTTLRRTYVRDLVDVDTGELLSLYNRATSREFVSDADLQADKANVERDWEDALGTLLVQRTHQRLAYGDTADVATAKAQAALLDTVMKLVAAAVLERMLADSGFLAYLPDASQRTWGKTTQDTIARYRTIALKRQGALGTRRLLRR